MNLVKPSFEHLSSYVAALQRGYSPVTHEDRSKQELAKIERDASRFLALLDDRRAEGDPISLRDGSFVPRLPSFVRWMWDGEFSGSISLRWQPGTEELPPWCLGHVGYSVVTWKRRRGYATEALRLMLPDARKEGLAYVEIVTNADNIPSQRVVYANGGVLVEKIDKGAHSDSDALRFRIALAGPALSS
ncbi:MAG: GNAT family N-acetyltransferase [Candidatus Eremiobacteraeota bacterium]|nr:GNAT family N-acetyltransferase [Candidatus Eremiobacteraeota bacterium]